MSEFVAKNIEDMAPVVPAKLGTYDYLVKHYDALLTQGRTDDLNLDQLAHLQTSDDPQVRAAFDSIMDRFADVYGVEPRRAEEWQTYVAEEYARQEAELARAAGALGCSGYVPEY